MGSENLDTSLDPIHSLISSNNSTIELSNDTLLRPSELEMRCLNDIIHALQHL